MLCASLFSLSAVVAVLCAAVCSLSSAVAVLCAAVCRLIKVGKPKQNILLFCVLGADAENWGSGATPYKKQSCRGPMQKLMEVERNGEAGNAG